MSYITRQLRQTGTYWNPTTTDKWGDPSFDAPEEADVRYENTTEEFIMTGGETAESRAIVYSLIQPVVGGYWYRGSSSATNPESVTGADKIRRVDACPDIKARTTLYKSYL